MRIDSIEGQGTTVEVWLPTAKADEDHAEAAAPGRSLASGGRERVLVVEDDAAAAELIAVHLRGAGLSAAFATNAEDALRLASALRPAAITLDVLMPNVDGWEVLSRLKSTPECASIPVLIVSVVDEQSRGLLLGANDYLVKPVARETLLGALAAAGVPIDRSAHQPTRHGP